MFSFLAPCGGGGPGINESDGNDSADGAYRRSATNAVAQVSTGVRVSPMLDLQLGPMACFVARTTGRDASRLFPEDVEIAHVEMSTAEAEAEEAADQFPGLPLDEHAAEGTKLPMQASSAAVLADVSTPLSSQVFPSPASLRRRAATLEDGSGHTSAELRSKRRASSATYDRLHDAQARLSEDQETLSWNDPRVRPIHDAACKARIAKARQALRELEACGANTTKLLGHDMGERIKRVGDCYEASLRDFQEAASSSDWIAQHKEVIINNTLTRASAFPQSMKLTCSRKFTNQCVKMVTSVTFPRSEEINAFKAFVGLCECDLAEQWSSARKVSKRLWPTTGEEFANSSGDGLWQVLRWPRHGGKEDNIFHVSCVDALDEPCGLLWFAIYTPEQPSVEPGSTDPNLDAGSTEGNAELSTGGVKLPPVEEGALRLGDERTVFTIQPLKGGSFELKCLTSARLSRAAHMFPGVMTQEAQRTLEEFCEFVHTEDGNEELNRRVYRSKQAKLYQHLQRHLEKASQGKMIHTKTTGRNTSWKEISCQIPDDWADHMELEVQRPLRTRQQESDSSIEDDLCCE